MPTIYDVAEKAGVSITTVSRVLNGRDQVSVATRKRVESVMQELNYVPSPSARSLNLGISRIIALVVPDISNPFYSEIARGVQDVCDERGYNVFITNTDGRDEKERASIEGLLSQRVDGICMVRHRVNDENIRLLSDLNIPSVVIGEAPKGVSIDSVGIFGTGEALRGIAKMLTRHGRRRLGHIAGPSGTFVGILRKVQFAELVNQLGLDSDSELLIEADFTLEGGRIASEHLLSLKRQPNAVFAANDMMAIGVLQTAEAAGCRVPEDVAVFGCDDIPVASLLRPSLTTVHLPKYELGQQAANLLFERIVDRDQGPRTVSLEARAVNRDSTNLSGFPGSPAMDSRIASKPR